MNGRRNLGFVLGSCSLPWRAVCLLVLWAFATVGAAAVPSGVCDYRAGAGPGREDVSGVTAQVCIDTATAYGAQYRNVSAGALGVYISPQGNNFDVNSQYGQLATFLYSGPVTCPAGTVENASHTGCETAPVVCPPAGTSAGSKTYSLGSPPPSTLSLNGCGITVGGVGVCLVSAGFCVANYVHTGQPASTAPPAPSDIQPPPTPAVTSTPKGQATRNPSTGYPYTETQTGGTVELAESLPGQTARTTTTTEPTRTTVVNQSTSTDSTTNVTTTVTTTTTTYTGGTVVTNVYTVNNGAVQSQTSTASTAPSVASSSALGTTGPGGTTKNCTGADCPNNPGAPAGSGNGNGEGDGEGSFSGPGTGDGLYERKYPEGFAGVWDEHKATWDQSELFTWLRSLTDGWPSGGSCPSWSISLAGLPGLSGVGDLSVPCWIWPIIKALFIISALLAARRIIFGGE